MATKEQERAALERIQKLIESVGGQDSYIGKAFEGCYLIAKENIDSDFWNSWKEKAQGYMIEAQQQRIRADKASL